MIGKILSHLLGSAGEDLETAEDANHELKEFEEGGWVIVDVQESEPVTTATASEVDPLENLLIEHPRMSIYQMRCSMEGVEEEPGTEEDDEEEEEVISRHLAVRRHVSWRLAAWGIPLPRDVDVQLLAVQKAGTRAQARAGRKKLSRSALHKQNLARARFSPAERRYGHFKQPCQRLCNY